MELHENLLGQTLIPWRWEAGQRVLGPPGRVIACWLTPNQNLGNVSVALVHASMDISVHAVNECTLSV